MVSVQQVVFSLTVASLVSGQCSVSSAQFQQCIRVPQLPFMTIRYYIFTRTDKVFRIKITCLLFS